MPEYIKIGQIVNTHGYKGGLKIYPLTDDVQRFFDLEKVYLKFAGHYVSYTIVDVRLHKNMVLLWLAKVSDLNTAEQLKGFYLEIPRTKVRALPEGSFYIFELIGLDVYEGEQYLGKLCEVLKPGSNDVFVVKTPDNKEIYLPALKKVVTQIDLEQKRMEVKVPLGLLD
ncbi:MAG TPA: 16S rRNA processing protein RimM [Clostridia bacterium]|jgi:16S rRNA processing protein RimM|nr:ribosome maturation factor RimM [Clostridia bacterium]HHY06634.1 16S rRNA processing protein RimM [Clostridia bacterium]